MWPYPWTHVGTPSHLGHMDRVAATMTSQGHAGAAQEAPDIGQWEGQDVPLVRPSSCIDANGARSAHVGLEYALCSRCMCLIEAFTRCGAFPVPHITLVPSSQVRKESACSCLCCRSAKGGLLKTLRLVLRYAVRHSLSAFCRKQDKGGMHDTQCINRLGWFIIRRRLV